MSVSYSEAAAKEAAIILLKNMSPGARADIFSNFTPYNPFDDYKEVGFDYKGTHFTHILVELDQILSDEDIVMVRGAVSYAMIEFVRSYGGANPIEISDAIELSDTGKKGTVIQLMYDTSLTRSHAPDFFTAFDHAALYIEQGSPKRKTRGDTRLIEGLNNGVSVRFYVK